MASSDPHLSSDIVEFADGPDSDNATQPSVQVEDSQYQEINSLHSDRTGPGDEEAVSETQFDNERPGSAGTVQSASLDSDHMGLPEELAVDTEIRQERESVEDATSIGSRLLSRPNSAGDVRVENGFSFAKASRQQMDVLGTRKGPALNMPSNSGKPAESVVENPSAKGGAEDTAAAGENQTPHMSTAPRECSETAPPITKMDEQPILPTEAPLPKTKRKNRKKRRYDTAREEPVTNYDIATPTETVDEPVHGEVFDDASAIPIGHPDGSEPRREPDYHTDTPGHAPAAEEDLAQAFSPQSHGMSEGHDAARQANEVIETHPPSPSVQLQIDMGSEAPAQQLLSPDRDPTQDSQSHQRIRGDNADGHADQTLHGVSHLHGSSRVSKPRSKRPRRATATAFCENELTNDQLSDINDYMQIISYKIRQMKKNSEAKMAADRENFEAELQQVVEAKQILQDQLDNVLQEKEALAATIDKLSAKLIAYESKFKKFKTFVDGLGNDIDALKRDANADRRKREELAQEAEERKAERDVLFAELNTCAGRFAQLEKKTLSACHETKEKLDEATHRCNYLDQQLNEKVGMLAEERDRRSQLEKQLDSQRASSMSSDQNVLETLMSSKESILDKLSEIYLAFQNEHRSSGVSDMLEKTFAAVQALNSQAGTTVNDVASAKGLIEDLNKSVAEHLRDTTSTSDETVASTFQARLDKAMGSLKEELGHREERIQQDAEHRERFKCLQERLKESDVRIINADLQISNAHENEKKLKEENAKLQARITGLQNKVSPDENAQVQMNETKAELDDKIRALESTKADLTKKTDELRNLSVSNDNLQQQLRSLQNRFEELQSTVVDFTPEREELQRRAKVDAEQVRKEMAEHAEKFEAELKTQTGNELKRLTSERNRLEKQLNTLTEELSVCKTRIQELEKGPSSGSAAKDQELERLRNLAQSQRQEMKALQVSLNDVQNSAKSDASLKKDYSALTAQFESERKKLLQTSEEKSALLRQVEGLQITADEARLARNQAKSELDHYQTNKEKTIKSLQKELSESKDAVKRSEAGREQLKKSCDDAIEETKRKRDRDVKALQERVSEAEGEREAEKNAAERFREEVEQTWRSQQQDRETRIAEIEQKVVEAESQRDEALQNNERVRQDLKQALDEQRNTFTEQLNNAQQRVTAAEEKLKSQQQPSGQASTITSRFYVPKVPEDITPTASLELKAPTKPKKKVDRNKKMTLEDSPVPAPEELRPDSRTTDSAKSRGKARGPVVEESQLVSDSYADKVARYAQPAPKRITADASMDSDDMLSMIDDGSRLLPQTIGETQSQERLPSFTAFNTSLGHSSQAPGPELSSSKYFQTSLHELRGRSHEGASRHEHPNASLMEPPGDFTIHEDSQESNGPTKSGQSEGRIERYDGLSWSQEETNKYTYQKSFPHPNSASKLVNRDTRASGPARLGSDTPPHSAVVPEIVRDSSEIRAELGKPSSGRMNTAASVKSSTPDFVDASSGRKMSTYHNQGGSGGRRRFSKTHSVPTADPRLAARDPPAPSKRKPEGQILEGYEHERKKRLGAQSNVGQRDERHFNLRSQTQSSMKDIPSFPSMHAGPPSSQYQSGGPTAQSRMRTAAGGSSRTTRGMEKLLKHDEFNARFSQELAGR